MVKYKPLHAIVSVNLLFFRTAAKKQLVRKYHFISLPVEIYLEILDILGSLRVLHVTCLGYTCKQKAFHTLHIAIRGHLIRHLLENIFV
jgi:hypothetical protein